MTYNIEKQPIMAILLCTPLFNRVHKCRFDSEERQTYLDNAGEMSNVRGLMKVPQPINFYTTLYSIVSD